MLGLRCVRSTRLTASLAQPIARPVQRLHLQRCFLSTTPRHHKDDPRIRTVQQEAGHRPEEADSTRPETIQKKDAAKPAGVGNDPLLAERTVSNQEQRKADWAIIKEMSQYLWPKVETSYWASSVTVLIRSQG